jgi:hypothetical protein
MYCTVFVLHYLLYLLASITCIFVLPYASYRILFILVYLPYVLHDEETFALSCIGCCHMASVVICLPYASETLWFHTNVARFGFGFRPDTTYRKS